MDFACLVSSFPIRQRKFFWIVCSTNISCCASPHSVAIFLMNGWAPGAFLLFLLDLCLIIRKMILLYWLRPHVRSARTKHHPRCSLKCQSSPRPSTQGSGWGTRRRLTFQATLGAPRKYWVSRYYTKWEVSSQSAEEFCYLLASLCKPYILTYMKDARIQ